MVRVDVQNEGKFVMLEFQCKNYYFCKFGPVSANQKKNGLKPEDKDVSDLSRPVYVTQLIRINMVVDHVNGFRTA